MFNHETALADDDQRRAAGSLEVRDQLDIYVIGMIGAIWAGHWLGTGALVGQLRADPMITGLRWRAWFHLRRPGRPGSGMSIRPGLYVADDSAGGQLEEEGV